VKQLKKLTLLVQQRKPDGCGGAGRSRRRRTVVVPLAVVAVLACAPAPESAAAAACAVTLANPAGPFYLPGAPFVQRLAGPDEPGTQIELAGRVLGLPDCRPVAGAVLDIWQANAGGVYSGLERPAGKPDFRLRGRIHTGADGRFSVVTVRPGHYGDGTPRPSHIHVTVSALGFVPLTTQVYFPGDPANAGDDLFLPALVGTLRARGDQPALLSFDFVLSAEPGAR
jgi:catechol 1,2-dioxygenase